MPKAFDDCVKNGGKVRTKNLKNNKYIKICYDKNGNSHAGEVMTKKKQNKSKGSNVKEARALAESLLKLRDYYNTHYHTN